MSQPRSKAPVGTHKPTVAIARPPLHTSPTPPSAARGWAGVGRGGLLAGLDVVVDPLVHRFAIWPFGDRKRHSARRLASSDCSARASSGSPERHGKKGDGRTTCFFALSGSSSSSTEAASLNSESGKSILTDGAAKPPTRRMTGARLGAHSILEAVSILGITPCEGDRQEGITVRVPGHSVLRRWL